MTAELEELKAAEAAEANLIEELEKALHEKEENLQELSQSSRQKIEKETEKILQQCYQRAKNILQEKRKVLDLLAKALVEKNTLQKEEIYYIFLNEKLPEQALLE